MDANHQAIISEIVEKSIKGREKMAKPLLEQLSAGAIEDFKKTAAPRSGQHSEAETCIQPREIRQRIKATKNITKNHPSYADGRQQQMHRVRRACRTGSSLL